AAAAIAGDRAHREFLIQSPRFNTRPESPTFDEPESPSFDAATASFVALIGKKSSDVTEVISARCPGYSGRRSARGSGGLSGGTSGARLRGSEAELRGQGYGAPTGDFGGGPRTPSSVRWGASEQPGASAASWLHAN